MVIRAYTLPYFIRFAKKLECTLFDVDLVITYLSLLSLVCLSGLVNISLQCGNRAG